MKKVLVLLISMGLFISCTENYSNGERIGMVTKFSRSGLLFKSWEGHLNLTQTGMNSSEPFDFSIDNDREDDVLVKQIDSAATFGWKVKLTYHETAGKNWFHNRGRTDYFVKDCQVLDRNPVANAFNGTVPNRLQNSNVQHDTIYVVIVDKSKLK